MKKAATNTQISPNLSKIAMEDLRKNENLLWIGQPRCDFVFVPYDWVLVTSALAVLVLATLLWFTNDTVFDNSWVAIFCLFALGIGTYSLARFPLDLIRRRKTFFLVTNQRIIVKISTCLERTLKSVEYSSDFELSITSSPHDSFTIYFGRSNNFLNLIYPPNYPLFDWILPPSFYFLSDTSSVVEIIRDVLRERNKDGHPKMES